MRQWWNEDAVVVRNGAGSETSLVLRARDLGDRNGQKIMMALFHHVVTRLGALIGGIVGA